MANEGLHHLRRVVQLSPFAWELIQVEQYPFNKDSSFVCLQLANCVLGSFFETTQYYVKVWL